MFSCTAGVSVVEFYVLKIFKPKINGRHLRENLYGFGLTTYTPAVAKINGAKIVITLSGGCERNRLKFPVYAKYATSMNNLNKINSKSD